MNDVKAFKALSDENRLKIFMFIQKHPDCCACKLLEQLSISQATLSHHMKVLMDSQLINGTKVGKWMHYSINDDCIHQLVKGLIGGDSQ